MSHIRLFYVFLEHGWLTNILGPHLAKIGHKNLGQKKNQPAGKTPRTCGSAVPIPP